MTHNKYLTFRFLEDNDPISPKSAAQVLSLNLAKTFLHLNFLFFGLYNSSASSFTFTPNTVFLSNKLIDHTCQCFFIFTISSNLISSNYQNLI